MFSRDRCNAGTSVTAFEYVLLAAMLLPIARASELLLVGKFWGV
jgi:hypothetical protein